MFLIALLGHLCANGQYVITGIVVNKEKLPIPYTSVYHPKDSTGTHSYNNGAFHLTVKSLPADLEFSNVGYKKKILKVSSSDSLVVQLEERIIILDEVVVGEVYETTKVYTVGSPKKTRGSSGYKADAPYEQLALMVKNKDKALYDNACLDKVSVKIVPRTLGGTKPNAEKQLRLRVYAISDNGKVGDDILHENIFLSPAKTGWYELVLEDKIKVPEHGFVLAVEWIKNQVIEKWKNGNPSYGLLIDGHKLKKEELEFYSAWIFNPKLQKWGWYNNTTIPSFHITLIKEL